MHCICNAGIETTKCIFWRGFTLTGKKMHCSVPALDLQCHNCNCLRIALYGEALCLQENEMHCHVFALHLLCCNCIGQLHFLERFYVYRKRKYIVPFLHCIWNAEISTANWIFRRDFTFIGKGNTFDSPILTLHFQCWDFNCQLHILNRLYVYRKMKYIVPFLGTWI